MKNLDEYLKIEYTDTNDYIEKLVNEKVEHNILSWDDIAYLVATQCEFSHSRKWYIKRYGDRVTTASVTSAQLVELEKLRVQVRDEKNQTRAYIRESARQGMLKDIITDVVNSMNKEKILNYSPNEIMENKEKENILVISDWHYGFEFKNSWNSFSPEICKQRVNKLLQDTIEQTERQGISKIHVLNLSDMIAGRIHLPIRLESRYNVIDQIMNVSEIIAEFLTELSNHFYIDYYASSDNHSRVEPDKSNAEDGEDLYRITEWYIKSRLKDNKRVAFKNNKFGADIITLNVLGHKIAAVHGDKDKPRDVIYNLTTHTSQVYEMICMAHYHHFQANENGDTLLLCNGSLMGVDGYAKDLRLRSKPSQTLITVTKCNVAETIHKCNLD